MSTNQEERLFSKNIAFSEHASGCSRSDPCPVIVSETKQFKLRGQGQFNGRSNSDCDNVAQSIVN